MLTKKKKKSIIKKKDTAKINLARDCYKWNIKKLVIEKDRLYSNLLFFSFFLLAEIYFQNEINPK